MICAGIGITPMRALAEQLATEGASQEQGRLRRRPSRSCTACRVRGT